MSQMGAKRPKITPEWLIQHGCAYDPVEQAAAEPDPIEILIDPSPAHNFLYRIRDLQPGFFCWAQLVARKGVVQIENIAFELRDAPNVYFELLPPPRSPRSDYCFPDGGFPFEPELVLNKHIPGKLERDCPLEGFLMGVAYQPLPTGLRGLLPASLSVFNALGEKIGSTQFDILLDPTQRAKAYAPRKRESVFTREDDAQQDRTRKASLPTPGTGDLSWYVGGKDESKAGGKIPVDTE